MDDLHVGASPPIHELPTGTPSPFAVLAHADAHSRRRARPFRRSEERRCGAGATSSTPAGSATTSTTMVLRGLARPEAQQDAALPNGARDRASRVTRSVSAIGPGAGRVVAIPATSSSSPSDERVRPQGRKGAMRQVRRMCRAMVSTAEKGVGPTGSITAAAATGRAACGRRSRGRQRAHGRGGRGSRAHMQSATTATSVGRSGDSDGSRSLWLLGRGWWLLNGAVLRRRRGQPQSRGRLRLDRPLRNLDRGPS